MQRNVNEWAVGLMYFAALMMMITGTFHLIAGLAAVLQDQLYVLQAGYVLKLDITTWGWIHLGAGILVLAAGIGLLSGATWARVVGVIVAVLSAVVNFAFLPWYPIWSALIIGLDIFVIWALTAHGSDITATS